MNSKHLNFSIPLSSIDLNLLPQNAQIIGTVAFEEAVIQYLTNVYQKEEQNCFIYFKDNQVHVLTFNQNDDPFQVVLDMLQSGKITEAIPLLEALSKEDPNSELILYNLGLAYSEIGEFDDAILRLKRLIKINPKHSNAWTGVGVAYQKLGNFDSALDAMTKAVELDGTNGYANRNLGAILMSKSRYNEALHYFRVARKYLPHDPQTLFGLASALQDIGDNDSIEEATELYKIIIQRWPASQVAELAQKSSTAIAFKNLKQNAQGPIRSDIVFYISGALDLFKNISDSDMKNLIFEIAAKGQTGLDINDSERKYTIKSLPGNFSGLNLLSIMYAGLKKIDPSIDAGIDFSQEYALAIDLQKNDK